MFFEFILQLFFKAQLLLRASVFSSKPNYSKIKIFWI